MKCVFVLAAAIAAAAANIAIQVFLFFKFKHKTESNMIVVNLLVIEWRAIQKILLTDIS